jgi:hypothetical protein
VTTVPERSTANRPVQATAFGASVQFGPSGSELQRPPIRLQRLGWTDPNLHRVLEGGSLESAYGSLANELLIDRDLARHLQVPAPEGIPRPGAGAPARERLKALCEAAAATARRAPSSQGLACAAATGQKPSKRASARSLPARLPSCRSRCRRPGSEAIVVSPERPARDGKRQPGKRTPGRGAPGRGPPRRPQLDKGGLLMEGAEAGEAERIAGRWGAAYVCQGEALSNRARFRGCIPSRRSG